MISSSDIESNGIAWGSVDNFAGKLKDRVPIVINTDLSSGGGVHWLCLYPVEKKVIVFDSLGKSNFRPNDAIMVKQIQSRGYTTTVWNGSSQFKDDSLCGWHAIYCAKLLKQHRPKTIDQACDVVEQTIGKTADEADVQRLAKSFGMGNGGLDPIFDKL